MSDTLLTVLVGLAMLLGLLAIFIPLMPEMLILWGASLAYGLLGGWAAARDVCGGSDSDGRCGQGGPRHAGDGVGLRGLLRRSPDRGPADGRRLVGLGAGGLGG